jgi:prepilin-type N-terminal cleavage/methylation domain-containing protein
MMTNRSTRCPSLTDCNASDRVTRETRRGFTIIEILVVLAIIAIIASVSLVVASRVTQGGKDRLTIDTIRTLDSVVQSYLGSKPKPPAFFKDANGVEFALIDARDVTGSPAQDRAVEPSLALFLLLASDFGSVEQLLGGIDAKLITRDLQPGPTPITTATDTRNPLFSAGRALAPAKNATTTHVGLTVKDAWGNPIRFVHPAFHGGFGPAAKNTNGTWTAVARDPRTLKLKDNLTGGTSDRLFRRSATPTIPVDGTKLVGDADESLTVGNLPMFYSAGADADPGTREDNVYSVKPSYPGATSGR